MGREFKRAIHWFRRDLRITDNTALRYACDAADEVVPIYVSSAWRGYHHWTGEPRQRFLSGSLASLDGNLRSLGSRLHALEGDAVVELLSFARAHGCDAIFTNADPIPSARRPRGGSPSRPGPRGSSSDPSRITSCMARTRC